ncbi:hypothetical protein GXW82_29020 [Streptacidiphilus sp. 4-A2]|nr:hypothetical protein [Streptacidiphilus sp. 4-A2]
MLHSLKAVGVLATAAAIAMVGVGTANATTHVAPFAAQVQAAGLNSSQATTLQSRVEQILHQYKGAQQVAANEIALPGGGSVLLPLPGKKYAQVLPGAVNLGFAAAGGNAAKSAAESFGPNTIRSNGDSCPYQYFCMWQGENGTGEQFNVSTCNEDQELPGSGWNADGSWINNQTAGTDAFLLNSSKVVIYTTPPPVSYSPDWNWVPYWYADACNH